MWRFLTLIFTAQSICKLGHGNGQNGKGGKKHQRELNTAIKRSRQVALLPYVTD
ncbi:MAG: hypothetical protein IJB94_01895 [Clostridia bacterium]|nr:hypothetical protein [Clostridia bacterium]